MSNDQARESYARTPRLRISLRATLGVITAVAILFGLIATKDRARRNAEKRIQRFGGSVSWDERGPKWLTKIIGRDLFATPKEVGFIDQPLADEDFATLSGLEDAEQLVITQNKTFTGSGLRYLANWRRLKSLYIYDVPLTDDGLARLPKLKTLQSIQILATRITDESIPLMEGFGYVNEISLGSGSISRDKVEDLDQRLPKTRVTWSGQGYDE